MKTFGEVSLTTSSQVTCKQQPVTKKPQKRTLEGDIAKALAEANLLGAHGIQLKGFKLDENKGFILEPGQPYSEVDLLQFRAKLSLETHNHKLHLWNQAVIDKNLKDGDYTEEDFWKLANDYEKKNSPS